MRSLFPIAMAIVACCVAVSATRSVRAEGEPRLAAATTRAELRLSITRSANGTVLVGSLPDLTVRVRNTSRTRDHELAPPARIRGNGGGLVPEFAWTVERRAPDGAWVSEERIRSGRCQPPRHHAWAEKALSLAPGGERTFEHGTAFASSGFDLTRPGRLRIRAAYIHAPQMQAAGTDASDRVSSDGSMSDYEPFALESNWIEFDLFSPLQIRIVGRRSVPFGGMHRAASILDVQIQNVSATSLSIPRDRVHVQLGSLREHGESVLSWHDGNGRGEERLVLHPGDVVSLSGERGVHTTEALIAAGATRPQPDAMDVFRVWLILSVRDGTGLRVRSNEVTLRVLAGE